MGPTFPCLGDCGAILRSRRHLAIHYRINEDCRDALLSAQSAAQQPVSLFPLVNPPAVYTAGAPDNLRSPSVRLPVEEMDTPIHSSPDVRPPVTVEEVEDVDTIAIDGDKFTLEYLPHAGEVVGTGQSKRVAEYEGQLQNGELPWAPFSSQKEWELAEWLVQSGVSQSNIDKLLKLQWVSTHDATFQYCANATCRQKNILNPSHSRTRMNSSKRLIACQAGQNGNVLRSP